MKRERRYWRARRGARLTTEERGWVIEGCLDQLRVIRDALRGAGCPLTTRKVRSAIKSAEGALRNNH